MSCRGGVRALTWGLAVEGLWRSLVSVVRAVWWTAVAVSLGKSCSELGIVLAACLSLG